VVATGFALGAFLGGIAVWLVLRTQSRGALAARYFSHLSKLESTLTTEPPHHEIEANVMGRMAAATDPKDPIALAVVQKPAPFKVDEGF
jgi:hypothetical protein